MNKLNYCSQIKLNSYNDLFGISDPIKGAATEIKEIPLNELYEFENHPFRVEDDRSMIALGCLSPKGLYEFLNKHKDVNTVSLILDNDESADKANEKMVLELNNKGYKIEGNDIYIALRESGVKDVNEYLTKIFISFLNNSL